MFWRDGTGGRGQVFENDNDVVTPIGSPITFAAGVGSNNSCVLVDSTHVVNFWAGSGNDGFVQAFEIDGSYNLTALGSALEFDTSFGLYNSAQFVDSTHVINFWAGATGPVQVHAQVFELDGSYNVSAVGSPIQLDTSQSSGAITSCKLTGDDFHFVCAWDDSASDNGVARVVEVNDTTYAVTALDSVFTFNSGGAQNTQGGISCETMDDEHIVIAWYNSSSPSGLFLQVFNINLSTYEITAVGTAFDEPIEGGYLSLELLEDTHLLMFWEGTTNNGFVRIYDVDIATGDISPVAAALNFDTNIALNRSARLQSTLYVNTWTSTLGISGQLFYVEEVHPMN